MRLAFKKDGNELETRQITIKRQCDEEFIDPILEMAEGCDAVVSMACGIGAQLMAEKFDIQVFPGQNTTFLGVLDQQNKFVEECQGCGMCVLGDFGAICPVTRCSKSLLNGPCGGSADGICEVHSEIPCAWQQIYDRLKLLGKLDQLTEVAPLKDWSKARDGGNRSMLRDDMKIQER